MKQTIAIIGSLDTKSSELAYMLDEIEKLDMNSLLIDVSGFRHDINEPKADISNTDILSAVGLGWENLEEKSKNEKLSAMTEGLKATVLNLYTEGKIDGIISAGGMQNTLMAKNAMSLLPYGFPKINVAPAMTVVEIDDALGRMDDVATVNSIADIGGGINAITAAIIRNGIAALKGQIVYGADELRKIDKPVIGIMNLGVMAKGASRASDILKSKGMETCMFHGTMHGAIVEKLVGEGVLNGLMMLCVHDILTEAIDDFRFCKIPVLKAPAQKKIPTLISLSGMDVIDLSDVQFNDDKKYGFKQRKYHYHNDYCVHVKVTKEEILKGGALLAKRLNEFTSPVTVVIPLNGFRSLTGRGEPLYDPEVDWAFIAYLHEYLKPEIKIVDVDANANDEAFSEAAAREMEILMNSSEE